MLPFGLTRVQPDLAAAQQGVEHRCGSIPGPHLHCQLRIVGVRHRAHAVGGLGLPREAVHHVQGHARLWVGPASGEVQDTTAAHGCQLMPVTEKCDVDGMFVGDGEQRSGGVLVEHARLVHNQKVPPTSNERVRLVQRMCGR